MNTVIGPNQNYSSSSFDQIQQYDYVAQYQLVSNVRQKCTKRLYVSDWRNLIRIWIM